MGDISAIHDYHAHVYFDGASRDAAWALREKIEATFDIQMGRFHEKPVGPHPMWSYQVTVTPAQFGTVIPWLTLNRGDLDVFVHAQTGDDKTDHTHNVIWLGKSYDLDLSIFG
jgi:aromatic ring-cleaving dioxygenase